MRELKKNTILHKAPSHDLIANSRISQYCAFVKKQTVIAKRCTEALENTMLKGGCKMHLVNDVMYTMCAIATQST
jgi:hypothetical protein